MIQEDSNLEKLKVHTNNILKKHIYMNRKIDCCPICGGTNYIKHGLYKGIQRFKCKECEKTFSMTTNSLWSYSKKNPKQWIEFVELMLEKKSLRFCAEKLGINLGTAFYWRHKILSTLKLDVEPVKLCGDVHIEGDVIWENFKGTRKFLQMEKRRIYVVSAKGKYDSILTTTISKYFFDYVKFREKVVSKFEKNSYIVAYDSRYIQAIAKDYNAKLPIKIRRQHGMNLLNKSNDKNFNYKEYKDLKRKYNSKVQKNSYDNISKPIINKSVIQEQSIKYFRLNMNKWFKSFHGIATKYLEKYLSWFVLFNLEKAINCISLTYLLSVKNGFTKTQSIRNEKILIT